jgi:pimeloyl-ACP methyl ester carboxylesterase
MNYPDMAGDVLHFMDRMNLAQAHIVGHSMGGKVAMWLALHHPERIQKLVVVDIAPVAYQHSFTPVIEALQQLPLEQLSTRKQAEEELATAIPDLSFRQFLLQNLLLRDGAYYWRINLDIVQQTAHHIVDFPQPSFDRFEFPALFIAGEYSNYVDTEAVMERFPKAKLAIIPETGHWLYVEAPDAFCALVIEWLEGT